MYVVTQCSWRLIRVVCLSEEEVRFGGFFYSPLVISLTKDFEVSHCDVIVGYAGVGSDGVAAVMVAARASG